MAANNNPIYTKKGNLTNNGGTTMVSGMVTATGDYTGVSANHVLAHTAGADGSYIKRIKFVATGSNTASVARVYLNNGSSNTTAANNQLIAQLSLPGTTASNIVATAEPEYSLEMMIPPSFRIYIGLGTTVAATWIPTCIAGDY
jgi:hypothetical protein